MSNYRVFLTGATGFIGSHIASKLLRTGLQTYALCRDVPKNFSSIHWCIGDLKDRSSLQKAFAAARPHVVIHCAAYGIRHHESSAQELININIQGTLSLMELAAQYGVQRWIQTGSCAEYASQEDPVSEAIPPAPSNLYGVTKVASTLLTLQQGVLFHIPTVVLRLFQVYGPFESRERLIPTLLSACIHEQSASLSSSHKIRDFVYVEDVADLYVALATAPQFPDGEIFNIGSGIPTTLKELGIVVESVTGRSGYFNWGEKPNRPNEALSLVADIKKSQNILKWNPKTPLQEGLKKMLRDYNEAKCISGT